MREKVRTEFTRQASAMSLAAAFRAESALGRLLKAVAAVPAGRVLDLACGPGIVAEAVAPLASELVGIDATPEMIRLAEDRFAKAGITNGRFQVALAESLPFGGAEFDVVMTRLSFHHFPDIPAVLSEVRRVLRPQGCFILADVLSSDEPAEAALHNALERLRDPTHVCMLTRAAFRQALFSAGFELVSEEVWEQERSFPEWAQIVADPSRTEPLHEVMRALARAGQHAGVRLREEAGEVRFTHTWLLVMAKPVATHGA
jgi:ubiquinone/menaquinone biosynthesis C-methylase UbiE